MTRLRLGLVLVLLLLCPPALFAEEPTFEFLDGLRERGLGDAALWYLEGLQKTETVSRELAEILDLETARSQSVAADATENPEAAAKYRADAQVLVDKFIKEHEKHEEIADAYGLYGDLAMARGETELRVSQRQKDVVRRQQMLVTVRTAFLESRPRFEEAVKLFKSRLDQVIVEQKEAKENAPVSKKRRGTSSKDLNAKAAAEDDWLNARFKLAMIDYHVAQTYIDPKDPEVLARLGAANKALDGIWQGYRGLLPGMLAHYWHGRAEQQLGQTDTALAIYDEVNGNCPPRTTELELPIAAFFAENFLQRMRLFADLKKYEEILFEAPDWIAENEDRKTNEFHGVQLELAKALTVAGERGEEKEKEKRLNAAIVILKEIGKSKSSYQTEAILLQRQCASLLGKSMEVDTFFEAVAMAESAGATGDLPGALEGYKRALELSDQVNSKERIDAVTYSLAYTQYQMGDLPAAIAATTKLAKESPDAKHAPPAAVLAISASLAICAKAQAADRPEAIKQLQDIADFTIKTWPNKAEADDARIALGRLKIVERDQAAAITTFEAVNVASDRYPQALQLAAQVHWLMYVDAKKQNKVDEAATAHRQTAIDHLTLALESIGKIAVPDQAMLTLKSESQLLLAEIRLETNEPQLAVDLVAPLAEQIRASNPPALDNTSLRTLVTAVRAYATLNDVEHARGIADILVTSGQDIPQVNAVLINVGRLLRESFKKATAALISANTDEATTQAQTGLDQAKLILSEFIAKIADRQLSLADVVFLGDSAAEIGASELARKMYERALATGEGGQLTANQAQALIRVRSQLIGLLRAEEKFPEALVQVDALIKSAPKALEPLIERAHILQGMATTDPAKFKEASAAWTSLLNKLRQAKKKPPAYYEVVYNSALCLVQQADASDAKTAPGLRTQALQLLKGTMALSPKLSGPDMVATFDELLGRIEDN